MADQNFYYLGTLTKPFGLKGELCAFFDVDDCERYLDLDAVFIETDGEMLPYMIERLHYKGNNQFIVKLQEVDIDNVLSRPENQNQRRLPSFTNKAPAASLSSSVRTP